MCWEGRPPHRRDVSATRLRGGLRTTSQVTSTEPVLYISYGSGSCISKTVLSPDTESQILLDLVF